MALTPRMLRFRCPACSGDHLILPQHVDLVAAGHLHLWWDCPKCGPQQMAPDLGTVGVLLAVGVRWVDQAPSNLAHGPTDGPWTLDGLVWALRVAVDPNGLMQAGLDGILAAGR